MIRPFQTLRFIARHPLASRRPLAAVGRYAWWQLRSRLNKEIEWRWIDGSRLVVKRGMTGATGNIYCGLHEFADMAFLLHMLRPDDLFVDIGANVGSYTILASAVCGGRTIAVEPDPQTCASLRRNVDINGLGARVDVVQAALGAHDGVVRFTVGHDTMNHIASDDDEASQEVALRRLDDIAFGKDPVLVKMDVEGFEGDVVEGGGGTLGNPSLLAIITENDEPRVRQPIEALGFRRYHYEPYARRLATEAGSMQSNNFLFIRDRDAVQRRIDSAPRRTVAGVLL